MITRTAIEFVQYVLQQNPNADNFGTIYDEMSRAACRRSFRNLGYEELARLGVSFSLLATGKLENIISEAQRTSTAQSIGQLQLMK